MMSKFSQQQQQQHQNILQPKRLNNTDSPKIPKGGYRQPSGMITGQTLTLNGVTIGLPSLAQSTTSLGVSTPTTKKGSNTMAKRNARERNRVKQVTAFTYFSHKILAVLKDLEKLNIRQRVQSVCTCHQVG